jgi:hypothetical protein
MQYGFREINPDIVMQQARKSHRRWRACLRRALVDEGLRTSLRTALPSPTAGFRSRNPRPGSRNRSGSSAVFSLDPR